MKIKDRVKLALLILGKPKRFLANQQAIADKIKSEALKPQQLKETIQGLSGNNAIVIGNIKQPLFEFVVPEYEFRVDIGRDIEPFYTGNMKRIVAEIKPINTIVHTSGETLTNPYAKNALLYKMTSELTNYLLKEKIVTFESVKSNLDPYRNIVVKASINIAKLP